ncbi:tripartite motif-containing protein 3-like [Argopecten irradians]|uniref:tripartite motif-containing protein 3-like n=1 Tax=Argopecten irradians TaxID=31199 RepID=UPI00370FCAAC
MAEAGQTYKYRCLICTNPYTEPRLLLCGHTFCCRCLSSYINAEYVTSDDRLYFPCPVCETPTYNDDANADVSTWATCLAKNDLLVSLLQHRYLVSSFVIHVFGEKNRNLPKSLALNVRRSFAFSAEFIMKEANLSATHQLNSISGNIGLLAGLYEMCHQHEGNTFGFYCVDHSAMCCNTCVLVSHRQCNNVKPMKDVIKKSTATSSSVESELQEVIEETKKIIEEDDLGIDALNAKEKEFLTVMTDRIDKAKTKLDILKKTFQSDVADVFREKREQLMTRRKCVNSFHINVENSHQLISDSEHQLTDRHRFVIREHTKNQLSGHYRRMDQHTKAEPNRFDFTLKLDETFDKIMKITNIGHFEITSSLSPVSQKSNGQITSLIESLLLTPLASNFADSTLTSDLAGSLQRLTVQTTPGTTAVDVWTGSVSRVHTVNASTLGGVGRPWLTGGIFTDNNELLITDIDNNRLLLFDDKYSYQREYKIDGHPYRYSTWTYT